MRKPAEYLCEVCGRPVAIEDAVFWMAGVSRDVAMTYLRHGHHDGDPLLRVAHPECRSR